ncbi:MAG: diacylglycerol/lipid kinase family protein [Bacteroidales bacterium]
MKNKVLFIVNPTSEKIKKKEFESVIKDYSKKHNFDWQVYYTEKSDTGKDIQKIIENFNHDLVIAGGGDGTINLVASQLIGSGVELGIIPAGSANGLAYNLDIPDYLEEALEVSLTARAKPFDAILINDQIHCFHLSDIGLNARVVKRFEQEGSKGLTGYGKQMFREFFEKKTVITFSIDAQGKKKKYKAEMLVIANARSFGTGAVINPLGSVDDGEFEIIMVRLYSWWSIFYLFRMFIFGKLEKMKYVKVIKTNKADIVLDKPHDLQTDGEIVNEIERLKIRILPSALKIRYNKAAKSDAGYLP